MGRTPAEAQRIAAINNLFRAWLAAREAGVRGMGSVVLYWDKRARAGWDLAPRSRQR